MADVLLAPASATAATRTRTNVRRRRGAARSTSFALRLLEGRRRQYVRDYARIAAATAVFRMSCIYGPRQFGVEDQGWIAWLLIAAITDRPISIFGDGRQVRDVLYIDDLLGPLSTPRLPTRRPPAGVQHRQRRQRARRFWHDLGPMIRSLRRARSR